MAAATPDRPNVVLVHCHDLGRRLGCYGRDVATSRIDALADDGVRLSGCYATAPQCSPSRASLYTGQNPHEVGMLGLAHLGWELRDGVRTMPECFADAGYDTHQFGVQHVHPDPAHLGYRHVHDDATRAAGVAESFETELPGLLDADAPVFASVGIYEPHRPFRHGGVDDEWTDRYDPDAVDPPAYLPDAADWGTLPAASGTDPDHEAALERLRRTLYDWMDATDDPLLDGAVDLPRRHLRGPFGDGE